MRTDERITSMHASHSTPTSHISELAALREENAALSAIIALYERDPAYGIPTRRVFDRQVEQGTPHESSVIYLDLDDLNQLNFAYGDAEVDRRIAAAFAAFCQDFRRGDVFCRYRSGDEFAAFVPTSDAEGVAGRVQSCLQRQGLSGSIVIQPLLTTVEATIDQAQRRLKGARGGARGRGLRGFILRADGVRIGGVTRRRVWMRRDAVLASAGMLLALVVIIALYFV
jgi:diguanylate cyclase (GGDEF)-like protein